MIKNITQTLKSLHLTFLLFFVFSSFLSFGQVDITKFSDGVEVSADHIGFTTLGDFVLKAKASGDFIDGDNQTIILEAPEHWIFKENTGIVTHSVGSFSNTSVSVIGNTITITFSASAVLIEDHITLSGIQVQAQVKTLLPIKEITRKGGTAEIVGFGLDSACGELAQVAGDFTQIQILFPGETVAPGTESGKTGDRLLQTAGVPFNIVINAVDDNFNIASNTNSVEFTLTTGDYEATFSYNRIFVNGEASVTATFRNISVLPVITVSALNTIFLESDEIEVARGPFTKLQILLPGEIAAPGTLTGKTGEPTAQTAGVPFNVVVNAVDAAGNIVDDVNDDLQLGIDGINDDLIPLQMVNGVAEFRDFVVNAAGDFKLNVKDLGNTAIDAALSEELTINSGTYAKLQILLPGETAAPGTLTGKTGTPNEFTVGEAYAFIINAVDENWNVVASNHQIKIQTNESVPLELENATLNNGTLTLLNIIFKIAGNYSLSALDSDDANIDEGTSSELTVNPGDFSKLQILLPGEMATPGVSSDIGKIGYPLIPERGDRFGVTLIAVDDYFNEVSVGPGEVIISSSDTGAVIPNTINLINDNTSIQFDVQINALGAETITATSVSNNLITTIVTIPLAEAGVHYKTIADGSWNDSNIWSSSTDSTNWNSAIIIPGPQDLSVNVSHNVAINDNTNKILNTLTINATGVLELNAGKLILNNVNVAGTLKNAAELEFLVENALTFKTGSKYQHNFTTTLGIVPQATWEDGSTCEIIGYTTATLRMAGVNGQSFYNFTWNSPNQNTANGIGPSLGLLEGSNTEVRNNFTVISTGTNGGFQLSTGNAVLNVKNYAQIGGRLGLINTNNGSLETVLNVSGTFDMSGGILQKGNGSGVSGSKAKVLFNGTTKQVFTKTAGMLAGNLNFEIAGGSIVDFGENILAGNSGTFEMKEGASLITKHVEGISKSKTKGNIQSTGHWTFASGTNFTYEGEALQETGDGLPETVSKLTIDNAQGVKLTARQELFADTLDFKQGFFDLRASRLVSKHQKGTNGILFTQNTDANPLSSGKAWSITVVYNAEVNQTVVDGNYKNLVLSGGGTKTKEVGSNRVHVAHLLSILPSTKLVTSNGFVISADLTRQGAIGPLLNGAEIEGNIQIQHLINGGGERGTRTLSTPINDSQLSNKTYKQLKNHVIITGAGGVAAGFDAGSNALSLVTYDETADPMLRSSFIPVGNLNNESSTPGHGFQIVF